MKRAPGDTGRAHTGISQSPWAEAEPPRKSAGVGGGGGGRKGHWGPRHCWPLSGHESSREGPGRTWKGTPSSCGVPPAPSTGRCRRTVHRVRPQYPKTGQPRMNLEARGKPLRTRAGLLLESRELEGRLAGSVGGACDSLTWGSWVRDRKSVV